MLAHEPCGVESSAVLQCSPLRLVVDSWSLCSDGLWRVVVRCVVCCDRMHLSVTNGMSLVICVGGFGIGIGVGASLCELDGVSVMNAMWSVIGAGGFGSSS